MNTKRRFWAITLLAAGCLSGALALQMRHAQRVAEEAGTRAAAQITAGPDAPRVAQVLRALKLVTVEVRSSVESSSTDDSWRGDVRASIVAPVTYYYGVDLSDLKPESVRWDPLAAELTLRVPRPMRLATEVLGTDEQANVQVSWTRLREMAGEYHLGRARVGLYERAHKATLTPEDSRRMEETTRTQISGLVRALAGPQTRVRVEFMNSAELAGEHPEHAAPEAGR